MQISFAQPIFTIFTLHTTKEKGGEEATTDILDEYSLLFRASPVFHKKKKTEKKGEYTCTHNTHLSKKAGEGEEWRRNRPRPSIIA